MANAGRLLVSFRSRSRNLFAIPMSRPSSITRSLWAGIGNSCRYFCHLVPIFKSKISNQYNGFRGRNRKSVPMLAADVPKRSLSPYRERILLSETAQ
jgi:hypothetical protein